MFLIEKIRHSEIDEVADILTDAFMTNSAYSLIFKKKNQLKNGLLWLFKTSLILNNDKQTLTRVIKEKDTQKIVGTFTVIPPQGVKNGIFVYSKIGIFGFILKFGLKPLIKMLDLDKFNKLLLTKSIKTSHYHYLSMVAVREEYRGNGVGSYAIKYAVRELISSNSDCKLIGLTTQLPENAEFYSRLGFVKLDEGFIDFKKEIYYNYNMKMNF